jgi:two-component system, OmpR family, sensor kinase
VSATGSRAKVTIRRRLQALAARSGRALSFRGKLIATLILVLATLAAAYVALTITTTRLHMQTIDQTLHRDLAARIVREKLLTSLATDNGERSVGRSLDRLMAINPSIEIYVLAADGRILDYSAPSGHVRLESVAVAPLVSFIDGNKSLPIFGDDPREPDHPKVFSAAAITRDNRPAGYVYVVLGGEAYRSVASMFETSYALQLSLWLGLSGLAIAGLMGFLVIRILTKRLESVARDLAAFEAAGYTNLPAQSAAVSESGGDEVDRLARSFRQIAERMVVQIAALKQVDAARRELVAYISHDLKTPLATLHGYLETLHRKGDGLPRDIRERYVVSALTFSRQLARMASDLLELASLDIRDGPSQPEPFVLDELIQDVCERFRPQADEKNICLGVEFRDRHAQIHADIGLIERAFANLIENAIKFTPMEGRVTITSQADDRHATVTVADTGEGIADALLPQVFDRFYRASPADRNTGSGLGLAIAKRIIELHGGMIIVRSVVGCGTTFTVSLPRVR